MNEIREKNKEKSKESVLELPRYLLEVLETEVEEQKVDEYFN